MDLSRRRLDFYLLDRDGVTVEVGAAPPDADGLRLLAERVGRHGRPVRATVESMNGARFVHDQLELHGWQVQIADALRVKGRVELGQRSETWQRCRSGHRADHTHATQAVPGASRS